jgi:hypothetical protein
MGDSRSCGTALASRAFTIARDGGVTSVGEGAQGRAGLPTADPRAAAKLDVYTRKLRKRLRDGVKRRGGDGWKVAPVSASAAALVTKEAVAAIFPTGLAKGACGMCAKHLTGLSLQLVPINDMCAGNADLLVETSRRTKRGAYGELHTTYVYTFSFKDASNVEKLVRLVSQRYAFTAEARRGARGEALLTASGAGDGTVMIGQNAA